MSTPLVQRLKYSPKLASFWNAISYPVGAFFWLWFFLVRASSRVVTTGEGSTHRGSAIYVNWHQHLPFLIPHHGQYRRTMLVSQAPYMEPIAKWCRFSGLLLIRGASRDDGKVALDALVGRLREGGSIVLAVDGPAGPARESKRGCVELSRMTSAPIIPVSYTCKRGRPHPTRWDSSLRPRFFDLIEVRYGSPILIEPDLPLKQALARVDAALN
jgi:lysophospholipid acyltransferase (LPLAT)-like uncharacterized protein